MKDIQDKLQRKEIDYEIAIGLMRKYIGGKIWHSKVWRSLRKRFLNKKCASCGSENGPFVVQHMWHPKPISDVFMDFYNKYTIMHPYSEKKLSNKSSSKPTEKELDRFERYQTKVFNEIKSNNLYVIEWISQVIRYWSFVDAKTYCQKCAYLEDMQNIDICPVCRINYKNRRYNTCYACSEYDSLEENTRLDILEAEKLPVLSSAIETVYKGILYRSRLEARWAAFFDRLPIEYDYEMEGFNLPSGIKYLPDFWLPQVRMWAEVKPREFTPQEIYKCVELSNITKCGVLVLSRTPEYKPYKVISPGDEVSGVEYVMLSNYHGYPEDEYRFFYVDSEDSREQYEDFCDDTEKAVKYAKNMRFGQ